MLDDLALARVLVHVVPALVAERARHERRAERELHLLLGHADLELVDHVLLRGGAFDGKAASSLVQSLLP